MLCGEIFHVSLASGWLGGCDLVEFERWRRCGLIVIYFEASLTANSAEMLPDFLPFNLLSHSSCLNFLASIIVSIWIT